MSWFTVRNQDDLVAKMFITETDEGYEATKITVRPYGDNGPAQMLESVDDLQKYGFEPELIWLDIEDWFENERESQENFV